MMEIKNLQPDELDRIIEMAWEDRTPFEAINHQFGITEAGVVKLMRTHLRGASFRRWRKRVNSGVSSKHAKKQPAGMQRFKSRMQRHITGNRISKR
ncbi:MAG: TIGR03643 family protein [Cryomorphaceae bacterium]|nr:MAG: TIGR03643 family protein [Cryomorphaceae bacterium]